MRFAWLGAGALSLVLAAGCSSTDPAPKEGKASAVSQAIQGGTLDSAHPFAVGVCIGGSGPGQCQGFCSGALIAPNVVVTARHCVNKTEQTIDCSKNPTFGDLEARTFSVTTNASMWSGSTGWHQVMDHAVPDDDHICGHDIALLILDDVIEETEAKPIVPGVQYPMWKSIYSHSFTAVGYGVTSPQGPGVGQRRIKRGIPVLCVPGSPKADCGGVINDNEFIGGDGTCSGDSGSSAYDDNTFSKADGNGALSFGVLSRGGEENGQCVGSIYTRLDAYRDLIINTVKQASNNWKLYPEPAWTAPAPPEADAGAKDSGAPPTPAPKSFGDDCTDGSECESAVCATDSNDKSTCSTACDATDATSCPDGYVCESDVCLPKKAEASKPQTTTTTTSGCAVASTGQTRTSWAGAELGLMVALGLLAVRRRSNSSESRDS
ncbi:hypothetical protein AKJ09_03466 [Labilithrix luteola]|uniref:Peptidase S1 domain-containing protein n=1 Tax=Labilithrix luteola TaxID=1391654 RepID=A0A0K1PTG5_9BACT|nr:trypsin-like serine protease [Labilithrix luteola]AKU96802.1 hypothetical protein AKJ09_03466 [Labilithrix luteola]